jgi:hypothetical protein
LKTNQGPGVQLTMMMHSLRKECSSLLCESVQGMLIMSILLMSLKFTYFTYELQRELMMMILDLRKTIGLRKRQHQMEKIS